MSAHPTPPPALYHSFSLLLTFSRLLTFCSPIHPPNQSFPLTPLTPHSSSFISLQTITLPHPSPLPHPSSPYALLPAHFSLLLTFFTPLYPLLNLTPSHSCPPHLTTSPHSYSSPLHSLTPHYPIHSSSPLIPPHSLPSLLLFNTHLSSNYHSSSLLTLYTAPHLLTHPPPISLLPTPPYRTSPHLTPPYSSPLPLFALPLITNQSPLPALRQPLIL